MEVFSCYTFIVTILSFFRSVSSGFMCKSLANIGDNAEFFRRIMSAAVGTNDFIQSGLGLQDCYRYGVNESVIIYEE